jgi:hypothetical protein
MLSALKSAAEPCPHPGTLICIAEFSDRDHEIWAPNELWTSSPHQLMPPGITGTVCAGSPRSLEAPVPFRFSSL